MDTPTNPQPDNSSNHEPVRERAEQDREIADLIGSSQQMVDVLTDDATVRAGMSKKSFDTQKIESGRTLATALDAKYRRRKAAMSAQTKATEDVSKMFDDEYALFIDFRETSRTVYKAKSDRLALSLSGPVTRDLQEFVTFATAGYTAAKAAPYTAELSKYDYTPAKLDERINALKELLKADQAQVRVIGDAAEATRLRNEAAVPVRGWVHQVRTIARRVFRKEPEQARKLDF